MPPKSLDLLAFYAGHAAKDFAAPRANPHLASPAEAFRAGIGGVPLALAVHLQRASEYTAVIATHVHSCLIAGIGLLIVLGAGAPAYPERQEQSPAIAAFIEATREYAALHRRLEATLPPVEVTSDPETVFRLVEQMAAALRAARPDATPGEFFADAVAVELRVLIADALEANGLTPADVRMAEELNDVDSTLVPLPVNGTFPWIHASALFSCVRDALPPLPPELQYRIVGDTLVLIDVHASLIVDVLPYALGDTEL